MSTPRFVLVVLAMALIGQVLVRDTLSRRRDRQFAREIVRSYAELPDTFNVGDAVPHASIVDEAGVAIDIRELFPHRCGVVYFFQPECPTCERIAPEWSQASTFAVTSPDTVEAVWIGFLTSHADARRFVDANGIAVPWYLLADDSLRRTLRIRRWPAAWIVRAGTFLGSAPLSPIRAADFYLPERCFPDQ